MKKATKTLLLMLCAVVLVVSSILGTVAYLTSEAEVKNTFTAGNVTIELKERKMDVATGVADATELVETGIQDIKIIPGRAIEKRPVILVGATSEDCWLFVKIDGTKNILQSGEFQPASGWAAVTGAEGWYQYADEATAGAKVQVFNSFNCKGTLSSADVTALEDAEITVTAYAIQSEGVSQATAFTEAKGLANPPAQGNNP